LRGTVVERRFFAANFPCPALDLQLMGDHVNHPLQVNQPGQLSLSLLSVLSHVFGAVDKISSSFSAHGKIGNFIIIISSFHSCN